MATQVSFRVPDDLWMKIEIEAARLGVSRAEVVRRWLADGRPDDTEEEVTLRPFRTARKAKSD